MGYDTRHQLVPSHLSHKNTKSIPTNHKRTRHHLQPHTICATGSTFWYEGTRRLNWNNGNNHRCPCLRKRSMNLHWCWNDFGNILRCKHATTSGHPTCTCYVDNFSIRKLDLFSTNKDSCIILLRHHLGILVRKRSGNTNVDGLYLLRRSLNLLLAVHNLDWINAGNFLHDSSSCKL